MLKLVSVGFSVVDNRKHCKKGPKPNNMKKIKLDSSGGSEDGEPQAPLTVHSLHFQKALELDSLTSSFLLFDGRTSHGSKKNTKTVDITLEGIKT